MYALLYLLRALLLMAAGASAAFAQGAQQRLPLCLACHGEKGQSSTENVPSLGGQPAAYMLIQLYMFREKLRVVEPMSEMARGLTDADLQTLADVMARLPPPQPRGGMDAARAARAEALIAAHRCAFCHNNLAGGDATPRIAAQREDYLVKSLRAYKAGTRREYQPVMAEVMLRLSDADILDLAHFLARTGAP